MQVSRALGVLLCFTSAAIAIPTPWSESLLEDINNLRASGLSEAEIALRFPRALFYPNPTNPSHEITVYSPPDLRSYKTPSVSSSSTKGKPTTHSDPSNLLSSFLRKVSSPFNFGGPRSGSCDDDDVVGNMDEGGRMVRWELVTEEDRKLGKGRFKEGVGRRGEEMGRKEDLI